jgi:hypothetical protein
MAAAGDGPGGDPGRAGVLGQLRGDHPAGRLCLGRGRAGLAERRAAAHESVRLAHAAGCCLAPGPTSAAAGCGPTSSPGRVRRWSPPGWSPMTPWPRPPSTAGGCWASPAPASSPRVAPADFLLVHGDPCRSRGRCGGGGAPAGNPLSTHSAVATTSSHLPIHPTGDAAKAPGAPSRRTCPLCLKPYRRVRRVVSLESPSRALSGRGTARMRRPERSHQPRRRGEAA